MCCCCVCSAGCGRTGALCVIDYTWNLLKKQVRCSPLLPVHFMTDAFTCKTANLFIALVCLFIDDHFRFQYLQFSSKHENPEAIYSSNQGTCCFFFFFKYITSNKSSNSIRFCFVYHASSFCRLTAQLFIV